MGEAATTKLSSKGQVVIPEEIRNRLGLETGAQFVVVGDRDVVILKVIQAPDVAEFDELVGRARKAAKRAGLKKEDVNTAIRKARGRSLSILTSMVQAFSPA
jgi:AbrB family looped-hinge helix DNA binding protein